MKVLFFSETGSVELLDEDGEQLWTSQGDEDFRDEFPEDFLDGGDTDDVSEYLIDAGHLEDGEEIEVREGDLEDYDDEDDGGDDDDGDPFLIEGEVLHRA